jgi:undecaprenyl-diphosphatase
MRVADAEQWLGVVVVAAWLLVAGLSAAGRLPRAGRLRRSTLIGTGVAAGLFALQASVVDAVADPGGISAADQPTLQWMVAHRSPAATAFFQAVAAAGGTLGMAVVATAAVAVLWVRRRLLDGAVLAVAATGAELLVNVLKNFYDRPRPPDLTKLGPETNYSLPSGHALGSVVVLGAVTAVVVLAVRRPVVRAAVVTVGTLAVLTIGLSRLYLGVHWLTDVLDGWLVAGTWLALCVTFLVHSRPADLAAGPTVRAGSRSVRAAGPVGRGRHDPGLLHHDPVPGHEDQR